MSICFIINPHSGGTLATKVIKILTDFEKTSKIPISIEPLNFNEQDNQISKAIHFDTVVIGGGDGTISNLAIKLKDHPRIGILPLGTGNDLARELGILGSFNLQNPESIINYFLSKNTAEFSIGRLEYGKNYSSTTHFLNYLSFGFDAKVLSDFTKIRGKGFWSLIKGKWSNRLAYLFSSLFNLKFTLEDTIKVKDNVTGKTYTGKGNKGLLFANIKSIMGLGRSNNLSSPFDNKVEAIVNESILSYISMLFFRILNPLIPLKVIGSSSEWILEGITSSCPIQIDGEIRPDINSNNFRISTYESINFIVNDNSRTNIKAHD